MWFQTDRKCTIYVSKKGIEISDNIYLEAGKVSGDISQQISVTFTCKLINVGLSVKF